MPAHVFTQEDFLAFRKTLLEEIKTAIVKEIKTMLVQTLMDRDRRWLRSNDACRLLMVSPGTLQNLRRTGELAFTKVGRAIYYDRDEITHMMEKRRKNNTRN